MEARAKGFKENIPLAVAILLVCVLFSLTVQGTLAMKNDRAKILNVFYAGAHADNLGVNSDLNRAGQAASKLAAMGKTHLGETDAAVTQLLSAAQQVREDDGSAVNVRLEAFDLLVITTADVYERLTQSDLTDEEAQDIRRLNAEINSAVETIGNDPYFTRARDFNKTYYSFPTHLIGMLGGVLPLDV